MPPIFLFLSINIRYLINTDQFSASKIHYWQIYSFLDLGQAKYHHEADVKNSPTLVTGILVIPSQGNVDIARDIVTS